VSDKSALEKAIHTVTMREHCRAAFLVSAPESICTFPEPLDGASSNWRCLIAHTARSQQTIRLRAIKGTDSVRAQVPIAATTRADARSTTTHASRRQAYYHLRSSLLSDALNACRYANTTLHITDTNRCAARKHQAWAMWQRALRASCKSRYG